MSVDELVQMGLETAPPDHVTEADGRLERHTLWLLALAAIELVWVACLTYAVWFVVG